MKRKIVLFLLCSLFVWEVCAEVYSGKCGENVTWTVDTNTKILEINGTGKMYDYFWDIEFDGDYDDLPGPPPYMNKSFVTVIFGEGVENIGAYAFTNHQTLAKVYFSSTIKTIERDAFLDCGLNSITIPSTVTEIKIRCWIGRKVA